MVIWASLIFLISLLGLLNSVEKYSKFCKVGIITILVLFSAFRDGLGDDYYTYVERIINNTGFLVGEFWQEPVFALIKIIILKTPFSYILYFLVMACLTQYFLVTSYLKVNFSYVAVLSYICFPILFYNTLNLVRQSAAASIFIFGIIFLIRRKYIELGCMIIFATLIHKSALLVILIGVILMSLNIPLTFYLCLTLVPLIPGVVDMFVYPLIRLSALFGYEVYIDYDRHSINIFSWANIFTYLNLFISAIYLPAQKNINSEIENIYKASVIFTCLYFFFAGISYGGLAITYRISFYFCYFIPILLCTTINVVPSQYKKILALVNILFWLMLFYYFMQINKDNPTITPSGLLPISSLFDGGI